MQPDIRIQAMCECDDARNCDERACGNRALAAFPGCGCPARSSSAESFLGTGAAFATCHVILLRYRSPYAVGHLRFLRELSGGHRLHSMELIHAHLLGARSL